MLTALGSFIWSPDFAGLVCGVTGTLLLAARGRWAGWGFVAFLASNVAWLLFAWDREIPKLLIQHAVFAVSSLYGVWTWLLRDRLQAPDFHDTRRMERDIVRRFDGGNALQLARAWRITVGEVYQILVHHWRH